MNKKTRKNICEEMEIAYELYKEAEADGKKDIARRHLALYRGMRFILEQLDYQVTNTYKDGECTIEISI